MTVRVAINGFGRIGRNILRAIAEYNSVVAINNVGDVAMECTGIFSDKEKAAAHLNAGAKKVSWCDNEWGFSCRMSDTAVALAEQI